MIRVLLADDEAVIRAGVRAILARDPGIEVVAEAANGHEAIDAVHRHRPDVALLDIQMPGLDGLAAAARIHRDAPGTAVVVLTTFGEDEFIARALHEGADGFLLKSGDPRDLTAGIHAVANGGAYLSSQVAARVIAGLRSGAMTGAPAADNPVRNLTPRERDVLALLGTGLSNAEIGARLHLVEGTVKAHVSAILSTLGVRNRVQAAIAAHKAGLVSRTR